MTEIRQGCIANALKNREFDILAHVTNCDFGFNSGVAKGIRNVFPSIHDEYVRYLKAIGSERALGNCQFIRPSEIIYNDEPYGIRYNVVNLYAQRLYNKNWRTLESNHDDTKQINYGALAECLIKMVTGIQMSPDFSIDRPPVIALPYKYGSCRAGG